MTPHRNNFSKGVVKMKTIDEIRNLHFDGCRTEYVIHNSQSRIQSSAVDYRACSNKHRSLDYNGLARGLVDFLAIFVGNFILRSSDT